MKKIKISKKEAIRLINSTEGHIFKVTFRKANGQFRRMVCRTGVHKGTKGIGLKFSPKEYGLIPVFDMDNGYRFINTKEIINLTVDRVHYLVKI